MSPRKELRTCMRTLGLTQRQLSEQLRCHQSTVSRILSGDIDPDEVLRVRIERLTGIDRTRWLPAAVRRELAAGAVTTARTGTEG